MECFFKARLTVWLTKGVVYSNAHVCPISNRRDLVFITSIEFVHAPDPSVKSIPVCVVQMILKQIHTVRVMWRNESNHTAISAIIGAGFYLLESTEDKVIFSQPNQVLTSKFFP